jgi:hypothetical protein
MSDLQDLATDGEKKLGCLGRFAVDQDGDRITLYEAWNLATEGCPFVMMAPRDGDDFYEREIIMSAAEFALRFPPAPSSRSSSR